MITKHTKKGILVLGIVLALTTIPMVAFAQNAEIIDDENATRVESVVEDVDIAGDITDNTFDDETSSDETQVEITISDEEVPLYAGETSEFTYLVYAGVIIICAVCIFGGVYLFLKKRNE